MIHSLRQMIGGLGTHLPDGRLVRAVPEPFHGGLIDRLWDAWAVITGRAMAVRWPAPGELEDALSPPKRRRPRDYSAHQDANWMGS